MSGRCQESLSDFIVACPICANSKVHRRFNVRNRDYWHCRECVLDFQWPIPSPQELSQYYDHSYKEGLYRTFVDADQMKANTAVYRYNLISDKVNGRRWLDVGCADGQFLSILHRHGHAATGIDLCSIAVKYAQHRGLDASVATIEELRVDSQFDVITAFDVLEHVREPASFLRSARRLMHDESYLVITTPDLDSIVRRVMGPRWYFYIPDEHLQLFSRHALQRSFQNAGLRLHRCESVGKPLTLRYGLTQFQEYNPLIHAILKPVVDALPSFVADRPFPFRIGESLAIACVAK